MLIKHLGENRLAKWSSNRKKPKGKQWAEGTPAHRGWCGEGRKQVEKIFAAQSYHLYDIKNSYPLIRETLNFLELDE